MSLVKIESAKSYNSNPANANMYMRTSSGSLRKTGMVVTFADDTRRWFKAESEAYTAINPNWYNDVNDQINEWSLERAMNHRAATGND